MQSACALGFAVHAKLRRFGSQPGRQQRLQMWEYVEQLRSETTGAAVTVTESDVAAELANIPDEELIAAMQVTLVGMVLHVPV